MSTTPSDKQPVRFYFADETEHDGFADGTTWNGFDNIWVTAETFQNVIEAWEKAGNEDPELLAELRAQEPDADGLYSFAYGYATQIVREEDGA